VHKGYAEAVAVAAGPRSLSGYAIVRALHKGAVVAAGPRFLSGYARSRHGGEVSFVAAGPRSLSGYACANALGIQGLHAVQTGYVGNTLDRAHG
jgi:hypothetical protein